MFFDGISRIDRILDNELKLRERHKRRQARKDYLQRETIKKNIKYIERDMRGEQDDS